VIFSAAELINWIKKTT